MFTANLRARSMLGHVVDVRATQKRTSGGSSDTEVNELAATPTGVSPSMAVTMVTPVANSPITERNSAASGVNVLSPDPLGSSLNAPPAGGASPRTPPPRAVLPSGQPGRARRGG